jgi:hypothetical protein
VGEQPETEPDPETEPEPEPEPEPGPTCVDGDGDGYDGLTDTCASGTDCDDGDADVHPGQTNFFDTPRGDGSFDYDCSGNDELELTDVYGGSLGSACDSYDDDDDNNDLGWQSNLKPCGQSGTFLYCDGDDLGSRNEVQRCR